MKEELLKRKIGAQIKKMLTDKWDEGFRIQRDPGGEFLRHWPEKYGAVFHDQWMKSLCRTCAKNPECGFQATQTCCYYLPDDALQEVD